MKSFFPEKWRLFDWFILVAIGGLGSALAWSFVVQNRAGSRTHPRGGCIANLKQIDGAVQQWALESKRAATDTYSLSDTTLLAYMRGSTLLKCPKGGRYTPGTNVADKPKCSLSNLGHTL